jgi:rSAM/selenodomain-associated transferase 2
MNVQFSIIIPVLNESERVVEFLSALRRQTQNLPAEAIVVDGGSSDDTVQRARQHCDCVVDATRGRASQQNAGAAIATGHVLVFLHADTKLPQNAFAMIADALSERLAWGRFDVAFDAEDWRLSMVSFMMNARSRATGIATGDQCIFMRRSAFVAVGGFANQPLMEDIELSKRLKRISPPACLRDRVTTSARRWEKHGVFRTIALMWWLRFAYWMGVSPTTLARWYGYGNASVDRD